MKKILIVAIFIVGAYLIAPFFYDKEANEAEVISQNKKKILYSGEFEKIDFDVEGGFEIYETDGKKILRVEKLKIQNGPDLHLVVSNKKSSFGNNAYKIVSKLKANKGSFNVELNDDIDFSQYKYLLIHCRLGAHIFAGAKIKIKR